tara:strand:+ start:201 stop:374 length:174 start_codon:yes stop_codon:yes gene_type:complete
MPNSLVAKGFVRIVADASTAKRRTNSESVFEIADAEVCDEMVVEEGDGEVEKVEVVI